MLRNLELYRRLIAIRIRAQMQYRLSFLADVIIHGLSNILVFLVLVLILQRFEGIGGWGLWEVAFLYGMVESAFGSMDMLFGGFDPPIFGQHVRLGSFDQMLLRPVSIIIQVFGSEFLLRRLGRIAQGWLVLVLAISNLNIAWDSSRLLLMVLVYFSLVAFFGGLFIAGATITFWTVESIEMINILTYGGTEMMAYPMHIYPGWMRAFFTYILPGIFLVYTPALYILGKPDPLGFPAYTAFLSPLVGAGVLLLGMAFWRFGMRHYQSTGT